ncbi:MAG: hypothetical protein HYV67_02255 [Candidatus Taylorbacteria bacterium]|nr:hypothetical protein [Candidatus Taylorbacteria bacterium]
MPPDTNTNGIQGDEKLLTGTEAEKLLNAEPGESYPAQSAKEFLTRTPERELKNVFGMTAEENLRSSAPSVAPTAAPQKSEMSPPTAEAKPPLSIARFLLGFLLVALILIIGLYIWGGVLRFYK